MFKRFLMKKAMQAQTKGMPKDQQEAVMKAVEEHPELFEKIAKEMKAEMKKGKNQMTAAMTVMPKYQAELQKAMGGPQMRGFNPNGTVRR